MGCEFARFRKLEELRDRVEEATGGEVVSVLERGEWVDVTVRLKRNG